MGGGALGSKNVSKLGSKEVRKLDETLPSPLGVNPRQGVRRTGEGSKVKIAQLMRDDRFCHAELVSASQYDTVFSLFTSHFSRKRVAFTLAEVLITLGIIGIVAALTLPSVVNNIKHKQLETGFKTAYSIFSQSVQNMKREDGEGLAQYYAYYDVDNDIYTNAQEFADKFYKYSGLKVIGKCKYSDKIMNYTNDSVARGYYIRIGTQPIGSEVVLLDELSNGMCSSFTINAGQIFFIVDINGAKKPNRLGHDVFWFKINSKDMLEPLKMSKLYTEEELENDVYGYVAGNPCSTKSKQAGNGLGCGYYALTNQNPDNSTKGYWESLPR